MTSPDCPCTIERRLIVVAFVLGVALTMGIVAVRQDQTPPPPACQPRAVRPETRGMDSVELACHPQAVLRVEGDVVMCVCPNQLALERKDATDG